MNIKNFQTKNSGDKPAISTSFYLDWKNVLTSLLAVFSNSSIVFAISITYLEIRNSYSYFSYNLRILYTLQRSLRDRIQDILRHSFYYVHKRPHRRFV